MFTEDRIIGKRYSHFLKGKLLDPFHLVTGSSKWFTENCCHTMVQKELEEYRAERIIRAWYFFGSEGQMKLNIIYYKI
jgi:hypothetical protein